MDLFKIIRDIEQVDPEIYGRLDSRRRVFKHFGLASKALTAAAMPALLSGIFQRAYGQGSTLPGPIVDVLNLALGLEYLEFYYYDNGLNTPNLIPTADRRAFELIRNDESGHIKVIRGVLGNAAVAEPDRNVFDYTGSRGGTRVPAFPDVFVSYARYLGVAQSFVDTGVRAYKGGAPILKPNKDILESALNIHSVEARHSSHIRTVRRGLAASQSGQAATGVAGDPANLNQRPKSWISGIDNGGPSPNTVPSTAPVYGPGAPATGGPNDIFFPAENNVTQAGLNITTISGGTAISIELASEAFDEPLDGATVKTIARNFVVDGNRLFG